MKINTINVGNYGKLNDTSYELESGINVFYGKNESGKSTLSDFIRYMLYGFSRSSKLEKTKYTPWSEQAISGTMSVELDDKREFDLERHTATRSVSHIFTADRTDIGGGTSAGEMFFGVDETLFTKTAYIAQNDISAHGMDGVADSIRNITSSLDEDIDADYVKKKLNAQKNALYNKGYKTGEIFELEQQKQELESQLEMHTSGQKELLFAQFNLNETKAKIEKDKNELESIQTEYNNLIAYKAKQKLLEIEKAKQKCGQSANEYEEALESATYGDFALSEDFAQSFRQQTQRLCDLQSNMQGAEKKLEELESKQQGASGNNEGIKAVINRYNEHSLFNASSLAKQELLQLQNNVKSYRSKAILFFALIVTFPLGIYFAVKYKKAKNALCLFMQDLCCSSTEDLDKLIHQDFPEYCENFANINAENVSAKEKYQELALQYAQQRENVCKCLEKIGVEATKEQNLEDVCREIINTIELRLSALNEKRQASIQDTRVFEVLCAQYNLDELKSKADTFTGEVTQKDEKTLLKEIDFYERAIKALQEREKELIKKTSVYSASLPKPGETESKINLVCSKLSECYTQLSAIELAYNLISQSFEEVKKDMAPVLTSYGAQLFYRLSEGKYKMLYVDPDMNLSFSEKEGDISRQSMYLSGGALDMAYIALRLSLVKHLYKEKPVLIFDDAFCSLDNNRLEQMLMLLCELQNKYQILIFTCHTREKERLVKLCDRVKVFEMG